MSKVESYANTDGGWGPQQPQMTDGRKQSVEKLGGGHSLSQLISAGAFATLLTLTSCPARAANECGAVPASGSPPEVVCDAEDDDAQKTVFKPDPTGKYRAAIIQYDVHKPRKNRSRRGLKITLSDDIEILPSSGPKTIVPSSYGLAVYATRAAPDGIIIESSADNTGSGSPIGGYGAARSAILVSTDQDGRTAPITINVRKGMLGTYGDHSAGLGQADNRDGVILVDDAGNDGDITVNFAAEIRNVGVSGQNDGIRIYRDSAEGGDVAVTLEEGSRIASKINDGVHIHDDLAIDAPSNIQVTVAKGALVGTADDPVKKQGIHVWVHQNEQVAAKKVTVTHAGTIHALENGIYITYTTGASHGGGVAEVTIAEGGLVSAGKDGVYIKTKTMQAAADGGRRAQTVTVNGEVRGGTDQAAVHLFGGGTITLGEKGKLVPKGDAGRSIKVTTPDTPADGKPNLLIKLDRNFAGIKDIENPKATTGFQYRETADGTYQDLAVGANPTTFESSLDSVPCGVYNDCTATEVLTPKLEDHASASGVFSLTFTSTLKKLTAATPATDGADGTTKARAPSKRGRVYEAVPSVLWDLTGAFTDGYVPTLMPRGGEVRVAQSGMMTLTQLQATVDRSGWGRIEGGRGERRVQRKSVGDELSYQLSHSGFAAGVDLPGGPGLVYRVGLHRRQAKTQVADGGSVEVTGTGVGFGMTRALGAGLAVHGALDATRFDDIEVRSSEMLNGKLTDTNQTSKGTGYALSLGLSKRLEFGGLALTQRGGLQWSSVSMKDLTTTNDVAVTSTTGQALMLSTTETVTLKKDSGLTGRYGVMLEGEYEDASGACCRLFGSLDLAHDFHGKRQVTIAGKVADQAFSDEHRSEVKPTSMRLGFGGSKSWNGGESAISGAVYHTTAGRGNSTLSGSVAVSFRF